MFNDFNLYCSQALDGLSEGIKWIFDGRNFHDSGYCPSANVKISKMDENLVVTSHVIRTKMRDLLVLMTKSVVTIQNSHYVGPECVCRLDHYFEVNKANSNRYFYRNIYISGCREVVNYIFVSSLKHEVVNLLKLVAHIVKLCGNIKPILN